MTNFQLGLIGYPLAHSLSPKLHIAALTACGLQGDYSLFPIHTEDKQGLKDLLDRIRFQELHGLNVTIPHKQNVIEFMDELTPTAQVIGAVNTIFLRGNKLIGDNTDSPGFLSDLHRFLFKHQAASENRQSKIVNRQSAIVLGAGGSARAVVYALLNDGWSVTLAARRTDQAQHLASSFPNYQLPITGFENPQSPVSGLTLVVNTTPVGMFPNIDQSPLPENLSLPSNAFVYDLVYNPRETKLVRDARAHELNATTGLGMLIEQAALSFEIWTGHNPPRELLWNTIETGSLIFGD